MKRKIDRSILAASLKRPIIWFVVFFFIYGAFRNASVDGYQNVVIDSDGRGYYAYLPAIFLYGDNTFESSLQAEMAYRNAEVPSQYYLFKDRNGDIYNKYFPGVALFHAPFFSGAVVVNKLAGKDPTGYSNTFSNFFYLGHLIYSILGIFFFLSCLRQLFPEAKNLEWKVILFYLATPLFYYSVEIPLSHSYTFLLFGVFSWLILRIKKDPRKRNFLWVGLVLGWITIVRPTNFMVVLAIPFLLGDWQTTKQTFSWLFKERCLRLLLVLAGFGVFLFVLLWVLHWQTGKWFFWPYNGEGFNWGSPKIWQQLFSFRTGIFLHTPLFLLAVISAVLLVRKQPFQMAFWWIYFGVNAYIIAAWWCWDYASLFGARPYTEHLFFLLAPLVVVMDQWRRIMYPLAVAAALVGVVRYAEIATGYMTDQRFTRGNYLESLLFWKKENFGRWSFTESCPPFGKELERVVLFEKPESVEIDEATEFINTVDYTFGDDHLGERIFITVELDKKVNNVPFEDVFVVMDATHSETGVRRYFAQPLYNDKFEAKGKWKHIVVSEFLQDNFSECNQVRIYLWNKSGKSFTIRNCKVTFQRFEG